MKIDPNDPMYWKKLQEAMRQIFQGTESGKLIFEYLESICFKKISTISPEGTDGTLVNEGQRRVLIAIEDVMNMPMDEVLEEMEKQKGEHDDDIG